MRIRNEKSWFIWTYRSLSGHQCISKGMVTQALAVSSERNSLKGGNVEGLKVRYARVAGVLNLRFARSWKCFLSFFPFVKDYLFSLNCHVIFYYFWILLNCFMSSIIAYVDDIPSKDGRNPCLGLSDESLVLSAQRDAQARVWDPIKAVVRLVM